MLVESNYMGRCSTKIDSLYSDGFILPQEGVLDGSIVDSIAERILVHVRNKEEHPIYKKHSVRDWHLVYPELVEFILHDKVLSQLKSVLGEDLILWRSHVFYKPPNTGSIGWHQDFGTFSGEDIGNNKISLLPSHISSITEESLSSYLYEAMCQSAPQSAPDHTPFWNMTVWVALSDITYDMGPLRFVPGSHRKRYPVRMRELSESDFWQNPFANITNKEELINACRDSKLVLDLDTSNLLKETDIDQHSYGELKQAILLKLKQLKGSTTLVEELSSEDVASFPMSKGSYMLFSERTLHGSNANKTERERLAINFRITNSRTLVYPSRLRGDFIDGFNINIQDHKCILLSGRNLNDKNQVDRV